MENTLYPPQKKDVNKRYGKLYPPVADELYGQ